LIGQQGCHVFLLQNHSTGLKFSGACGLFAFFCHAAIARLCAQVSSQVQDLSEQFALQVCFILKVIVIP
ncbi:MAG: hypothetical protein ACKPKO_24060, partial [Candidatus Fonsibacter sp.]